MEWIYKPFSYTAVIVGLGFLIKYLIQRKIDSYFNKKLEQHKQELAVMTEKAKYDISRKLFDFEAYATKKHTIYPELYQRVFEVRQSIIGYDIQTADKTLRIYDYKNLSLYDEKVFNDKLMTARDYYYKNVLFLSKNVASICLVTLGELYLFSRLENRKNFAADNVSKAQDEIDKKIELLKETIYEELSYSHFEETEEKAKQSS